MKISCKDRKICREKIGCLAIEIFNIFIEARLKANEMSKHDYDKQLDDNFIRELQERTLKTFEQL